MDYVHELCLTGSCQKHADRCEVPDPAQLVSYCHYTCLCRLVDSWLLDSSKRDLRKCFRYSSPLPAYPLTPYPPRPLRNLVQCQGCQMIQTRCSDPEFLHPTQRSRLRLMVEVDSRQASQPSAAAQCIHILEGGEGESPAGPGPNRQAPQPLFFSLRLV